MKFVVAFARFWLDFVVGDDWRVAAGVVAALALTSELTHHDLSVWWLMPVAVVLVLLGSLRRATRSRPAR
ncbi:MAG TPA: hypothetical protein VGJ70_26605 [Solirubrobacteraceae bacterium]|jgi:hypothetical protein